MRRCAGFTIPSGRSGNRAKTRAKRRGKELVAAGNGPYIKRVRRGRRGLHDRAENLAMHEH